MVLNYNSVTECGTLLSYVLLPMNGNSASDSATGVDDSIALRGMSQILPKKKTRCFSNPPPERDHMTSYLACLLSCSIFNAAEHQMENTEIKKQTDTLCKTLLFKAD